MSCDECRGLPYQCQSCREEELERLMGVPDDHFETADDVACRDRDVVEYCCTNCGEEYETDGSDPCPECGARRRRYTGPLEGRA